MENLPMKELRGLKDWMQNAAEASVDATEKLHLVMMRKPFASLEKIDAIAAQVHLIESAQHAVTLRVFQSMRAVNKIVVKISGRIIDQIEAGTERFTR